MLKRSGANNIDRGCASFIVVAKGVLVDNWNTSSLDLLWTWIECLITPLKRFTTL